MTTPFTPEVVTQVAAHMNGDHTDDNLLIVRALGGHPEAQSARMSGMDADGIDFRATLPSGEVSVRLQWSHRLTERAQVRLEVVALHERAVEVSGGGAAVPDRS